MGIYLNPDNDLFARDVRSEIYVDKSMLISFTNKKINTNSACLCVSRPRRFGKSMAANMLAAYYSKGSNSAELFSKLKISNDNSFAEHLNKYNVIKICIHDFLNESISISDCISEITEGIIEELQREFPDIDYSKRNLMYVLDKIYAKTKALFVFIIDEWDCVFRIKEDAKDEQKLYLDFIRDLFKDKPYAALVYMTGILPIKKYGLHSALNMFSEFSMTNQYALAEYTGFTEAEVKELCDKFDMPFDEARRWYDGYKVKGLDIYSPRSVVLSMINKEFNSYWTSTETYEALKKYIVLDIFGLHDKVTRLVSGDKIKVNTEKFQNDMTSVAIADDVFTLLVHLGYLTYDNEEETVWIPNNEVRREFINSIDDSGWENVMKLIKTSEELLSAVTRGDEKRAAELLEQAHQDNVSLFEYNDENSLSCVVALAFYTANKDYVFQREMPSGKGRTDLTLIPRKKSDKAGIVIELKHNDTAENAIAQIKEKNYADSLRGLADKALLVGFSYDDNKHHSCKIEQIDL